MIFVAGYGCTTAAGKGVDALWDGAQRGRDYSQAYKVAGWPVPLTFEPRACLWLDHFSTPSWKSLLLLQMHRAWAEARAGISLSELGSLGVIMASTKGYVEDVIWQKERPLTSDVLAPLLDQFLLEAELSAGKTSVISNACASSLSAFWLAGEWLRSGHAQNVLVLAVDAIGPFVLQGFQCLHATTTTRVKPFAGDRSGLQLGEAAAAIWLSTTRESDVRFDAAAIDAEGYAVTRPAPSGESLSRAINALSLAKAPDLILAHGTGTQLNDATEDLVYSSLFGNQPAITASKWCIGHTLGASGAVDLILAAESIRRGRTFAIENTDSPDPRFKSRYLCKGSETQIQPEEVLITSLGFGGIHAAAHVSKVRR